jgi:hypothetical protein
VDREEGVGEVVVNQLVGLVEAATAIRLGSAAGEEDGAVQEAVREDGEVGRKKGNMQREPDRRRSSAGASLELSLTAVEVVGAEVGGEVGAEDVEGVVGEDEVEAEDGGKHFFEIQIAPAVENKTPPGGRVRRKN